MSTSSSAHAGPSCQQKTAWSVKLVRLDGIVQTKARACAQFLLVDPMRWPRSVPIGRGYTKVRWARRQGCSEHTLADLNQQIGKTVSTKTGQVCFVQCLF